MSMISSGIDSPIASFAMIRRGVNLSYVHFHSSPATSRQSIKNVEEILMVLAKYQIQCKLFLVPLLKIQQKIMADAPNKLWVILFRRAMIRIASNIAEKIDAPALVSGESVWQVASQTLSNIRATADAADHAVLRAQHPLPAIALRRTHPRHRGGPPRPQYPTLPRPSALQARSRRRLRVLASGQRLLEVSPVWL